jgi:hypothetical protein
MASMMVLQDVPIHIAVTAAVKVITCLSGE